MLNLTKYGSSKAIFHIHTAASGKIKYVSLLNDNTSQKCCVTSQAFWMNIHNAMFIENYQKNKTLSFIYHENYSILTPYHSPNLNDAQRKAPTFWFS